MKLNAYEMRGLRQILKTEHAYANRNNRYAKFLATTSAITYPPDGNAPHIQIMKICDFH